MADQKTFTIKIDGVEKSIEDITTLREELNKTSAGSSSITSLTDTLKTLEEAYKSLSRTEQDSELGKQFLQSIELYQTQLAAATQTLREQEEEVKDSLALRETEMGSVEQLKLLIKQLTADYEELSESERKVSGSDLLFRIQLLQENLTDLEEASRSPLSAFGSFGETIYAISDRINDTNTAVSSFSGILSASSDVLNLFGVESQTLTDTIGKLGEITKTASTLQALYTQLVAKDSIVMKAAAVAKKLYTAATEGSSMALKGFRGALVSTGIGALIVLIGYLIANFDDIKKQVGEATGGMDKFDAIMQEIEPVIAGVGNALIQYLLTPIKALIAGVTGLINVIQILNEKGISGIGDAFDEIGNTANKAVDIVKNGYNVVGNFEKGYNKSRVESAQEATQKILGLNSNLQDEYIKDMEAKNGEDWKYTKDGIAAYEAHFAARLAMYEKDSEDYRNIQREKTSFEHKVEERQKPKSHGGRSTKKTDDYSKELKSIQKEIDALYKESEEKQVEHLKKLAAGLNNENALMILKDAAKIELNIQSQKHKQETKDLEEHLEEMRTKYHGNKKRLEEIDRIFGEESIALQKKQEDEKNELVKSQGEERLEIENRIKATLLNEQNKRNKDILDAQKELFEAQNELFEAQKKTAEKANKDLVAKNSHGLIDVTKTEENYAKAKKADEQYLKDLKNNLDTKNAIFDKELELAKGDSKKVKEINAKKIAENENFLNSTKTVNERIKKNDEDSSKVRQKHLQEIHDKMAAAWGKINEGLTSAFAIANSIMKQQMEEAKAKLGEVTKQYDAIVEKRKESQDKIKSLEEEASSASGGRAIVLQEQIARQMEANEELAIQEKDLAKQKEKLEKDIAKKEKQAKKVELGQKLIEGVANTALAVIKAYASAGPIVGAILAGLVGAAGAVQTAVIARQISKLEDGGLLKGKAHTQGGMRIEGSNIEVEGDEFVVNRISTRKNLGLIDYINKQRRELSPADLTTYFAHNGQKNTVQEHTIKHLYEQGGQLTNLEVIDSATAPDSNKILDAISRINFQPVVSVVDIANTQHNITQVKDIAGV